MEFITLQFGSEWSLGQPARSIPALRSKGVLGSRLPTRTDFSALTGKTVLILADEDNLRISTTREHGLRLSFDLLLRKLSAAARRVSPWAIITACAGDTCREKYLLRCGWQVLKIPRETVMTVGGPRIKANADMDICFLGGSLITNDCFDATIVASGDGDLCIAIGRGIRRVRPGHEILTASVPGSTSHRILAANNSLFDGNVLLGRDVTQPIKSHASTAITCSRLSMQGENHDVRFGPIGSEGTCNGNLRLGKY